MAIANLNTGEELVTNTTAASKYMATLKSLIEEHARLILSDFFSTLLADFQLLV